MGRLAPALRRSLAGGSLLTASALAAYIESQSVGIAPRWTCREAPAGFFFAMASPHDTPTLRAITFFDGQNLYRSVKDAWGCSHPNYDVVGLSRAVCEREGWILSAMPRFYTGVPREVDSPRWHTFWANKLRAIGRQGCTVFKGQVRYRTEEVRLGDGTQVTRTHGREKGVDVRIAIDLIRLAHRRQYDVAVVFSQDQDLREVAREIKEIAREQQRRITVASAFPFQPPRPGQKPCRGIDQTQWVRMEQEFYERYLDPHDYRGGAA